MLCFTGEINKIALSSGNVKRMQSIDSVGTYEYGVNKDVICKKEEIRCSIITKNTKIVFTTEDKEEHNPNLP